MQRALDEMDRRRAIQRAYNVEHGITPQSIVKSLEEMRLVDPRGRRAHRAGQAGAGTRTETYIDPHDPKQRSAFMEQLERRMREASANLEFEEAALLRDQLNELRAMGAPNVRRGGGGTAVRQRRGRR